MIELSRWMKTAAFVTLAVLLVPVAARSADGLVALTPHPNEHVSASPKVVTVEVAGKATVERSAVRMVVDGRDVSDAITTTHNLVQYKPAQPLAAGEHAVEIAVTDAAGGRLSYAWTFTVDGATPQTAQRAAASSPDAAATAAAPSASDGATAGEQPGDASDQAAPGSQVVMGQQNFYGGFYPIGGAPYYWGDNAQFEFNGIPGGYGFLTFTGIPGVFDLLPLGLNTFYAIVPIPVGFAFGPPFVTCHFFTPGGRPTVVVLPSFPVLHHRRATEPVAHIPSAGRSTSFHPGVGGDAQVLHGAPVARSAPSTHLMPHFTTTAHPVHGVTTTQPVGAPHPIVHFQAPPHMVAPAPAHLTTSPVMLHVTTAPAMVHTTTRTR